MHSRSTCSADEEPAATKATGAAPRAPCATCAVRCGGRNMNGNKHLFRMAAFAWDSHTLIHLRTWMTPLQYLGSTITNIDHTRIYCAYYCIYLHILYCWDLGKQVWLIQHINIFQLHPTALAGTLTIVVTKRVTNWIRTLTCTMVLAVLAPWLSTTSTSWISRPAVGVLSRLAGGCPRSSAPQGLHAEWRRGDS